MHNRDLYVGKIKKFINKPVISILFNFSKSVNIYKTKKVSSSELLGQQELYFDFFRIHLIC
jgi:hypothetical protein